MPDKKDETQEPVEVVVAKSGDIEIKNQPITKPIISGIDQHVVLSQEDIDARIA